MNNFELHQRAQELADTHSAYELAREVLRLREELKKAPPQDHPHEHLRGIG